MQNTKAIDSESAVKARYSAAATIKEPQLCCPVKYDPRYLQVIPVEVMEKDYGCGDPSRYLQTGETVLDLGAGAGKICFIASQVVGPKGKVIGVDMTDAMLEVARRNAVIVAQRLGYANVEFRKGRIQDLQLDVELLDRQIKQNPVSDTESFFKMIEVAEDLRACQPLVASNSIDVIVSNCVLNLVETRAKQQLFEDMLRVLQPAGRAVISDIIADRPVPEDLQKDPELWSGCISGAFTESGLLHAFAAAGFHEVQILERGETPWRIVAGIDFRSVTVRAFKRKTGSASEDTRDNASENSPCCSGSDGSCC
jgi:arsenite methyltransferase